MSQENKGGSPRRNINFRQTSRAYAAIHQTQIYAQIKRSIPYVVSRFSASRFRDKVVKLHTKIFSKTDFLQRLKQQ